MPWETVTVRTRPSVWFCSVWPITLTCVAASDDAFTMLRACSRNKARMLSASPLAVPDAADNSAVSDRKACVTSFACPSARSQASRAASA